MCNYNNARGRKFKICLIISLILHILILRINFKYDNKINCKVADPKIEFKLKALDIKEMRNYQKSAPASVSSKEIKQPTKESPSEIILDEIKHKIKLPDFSKQIKEKRVYQFYSYQELPELIGGIESLRRKIPYPKGALNAGIEDRLKILILLDANGKIKDLFIIEKCKHPGMGFEAVVINALMNSKWRPARQRGKAVKVQIAMPFKFEIR